ncbi:hypothetical protein E2C01_049399 [Portunus trituberculatus]|uniref:Uncharacterized protein n=1 Tax=Portunus trituberculatus TaxID=210409 RepID=A0A5B7GDL7_PORTR|nr:hypothetical protein [Portunus trituberculatus]
MTRLFSTEDTTQAPGHGLTCSSHAGSPAISVILAVPHEATEGADEHDEGQKFCH